MMSNRKLLWIMVVAALLQGTAVTAVVYGAYRFGVYQGWLKEIK